jgi:hypothetical protein
MPGNDLEIETQGDGATVGIKENDEYVKGKLSKDFPGKGAGEEVLVKAIDFTGGGDEDEVTIMFGGSKKMKVLKKYVEIPKLIEYGVYNSETDTQSNPKTGENKPNLLTGFISGLSDSVKNIISDITELKKTVEENSELSYDSLDICVAELASYLKSLDDEADVSASANPN